MPLDQLHIVEKIKYLTSSSTSTKKQIADEMGENAKEHRILNRSQEREDNARVDHAQRELREENKTANQARSRLSSALVISIVIGIILLIALVSVWYFHLGYQSSS